MRNLPKWLFPNLFSAAFIGLVGLSGCKRVDETPPPPVVATIGSNEQVPSTQVAPAQNSAPVPAASTNPSPSLATPPVPAAPVVFTRQLWPSIELADGRIFQRARVSAEDGGTVTLLHAGGIAKVDKRLLPAELAALHPYDAEAAQADALQASAQRQAAAAAARIEARRSSSRTFRPTPAPNPQPAAISASAADIERAVRVRARRYFTTEKRIGSGQTLSFDVLTDVSEPRAVSGWPNRWEVTGTAGYKVYESVGWGSFSKRSTKFSAVVETPPNKPAVVLSFEER